MSFSRTLPAFALLSVLACASQAPSPRQTLEAYREALAKADAETLVALSDEGFRENWDEVRLTRWLQKNPRLLQEALGRLDEGFGLQEAHFFFEGHRVRLVREGKRWRVAEGGVLVARFDTPEAALETFFFASTGHLGLLRKLIPDSEVSRFASDFALGKHLYSMQARIFRARDELGPIRPGMAQIEGDRATISYGTGKAVEMVLEGGRWRILDIE